MSKPKPLSCGHATSDLARYGKNDWCSICYGTTPAVYHEHFGLLPCKCDTAGPAACEATEHVEAPDFIDCPRGCGRAARRECDGRYWCPMGQHYTDGGSVAVEMSEAQRDGLYDELAAQQRPGGAVAFTAPDWYPRRNVTGSTPFVNVRGCWFCGASIEPLNGMCEGCDKERPWLAPNASIVTTFMQVVNTKNPNWWREYIGGPDACVYCRASDAEGPIEHVAGCAVEAILAQLHRSS